MAEQEISRIKLTFESNVTETDIKTIDKLVVSLEELDKVKVNDHLSDSLKKISEAFSVFNNLDIKSGIGASINNIVSALGKIDKVKDISPYADNVKSGFETLADAVSAFDGVKAKINASLGKGVGTLVTAISQITEVKDITPYAQNIKSGFAIMAEAVRPFEGESIFISTTLGRGITGLIDATNKITQVNDITPYASNLKKGFAILQDAAQVFDGDKINIPVNLGRGITGIIDATNKITEVKDISQYSQTIKNNFATLAEATRSFSGLNSADYSGISRLITSMTSVSKVKPIGNNVVKNAETLAKAINVLDTNVTAGTPKLQAMSEIAKTLGVNFNSSKGGVNSFGKSLNLLNFTAVIYNIRRVTSLLRSLTSTLYGTVDAYGGVQNTISFFSQSLGSEASKTAGVIQQYADAGIVSFTEFADSVAKINQMYTSYGIASEDAAKMALNMTQLAYDASYALGENGKDIDLWLQRATSVVTGQTRSGYYFGVDLSIKSLANEFDELSSKTDKATKSTAAYETILKNTTAIQNQMVREIDNTYVQMTIFQNQLTKLKEAIGRALVPMFKTLISWGLTALKVIELLIDAIVKLFGGEGFQLIDYSKMIEEAGSGVGSVADSTEDVASGMGDAVDAAKEFKKTISGIDQVFTINDQTPTSGGSGGGGGGASIMPSTGPSGYSWLDELASTENARILEDAEKSAQKILGYVKKAAPYVAAIAAGFAAWKISKALLDGLQWISGLKNIGAGIGLDKIAFPLGLLLFLDDLKEFKEFFDDFLKYGPNLYNVAGMLSNFAGMLGAAFLMFGNLKMAGIFMIIEGLGDIVVAIKDMSESGINWDNVSRFIEGISNLGIGIGLLSQNWVLTGVSLVLQGAIGIIDQLKAIWAGITTGDWGDLDIVQLIIDGLKIIGGLAIALGVFKFTVDTANKGGSLAGAATATQTVSDATGGVSSKLGGLAKNIGLGILILAEVALAAIIFVAAIWAIGELLQQVGEAWGPVIADGKNIAIAIGAGTVLLAAIGLVAYGLGTLVLSGVGATVPLAIGLGTAMLLLLTEAFKSFTRNLVDVADVLSKELSPAMSDLNDVMPDLTNDMRDFTAFMIEFAGHAVAYTASSALAGLAGTIDTIVGWFTKDPIKKMADDAKKNKKQFKSLKEALEETNPLAQKANDLLIVYTDLLTTLKNTADRAKNIGTMPSVGSDFKAFSKDLKAGFADLASVRTDNISKIMTALNSIDLSKFRGIGTDIVKAMELGINNYTYNFTTSINKIKNAFTFSTTSYGTNIASGVVSGINNYGVSVTTFTNKVKNSLSISGTSIGSGVAKDVVSGINSQSVSVTTFTNRVKNNLEFSSTTIGANIARGVTSGINGYYPYVTTFTNRLKTSMLTAFNIKSPSRWAKTFVGEMISAGVEEGVNESKVSFNPFKKSVTNSLTDLGENLNVSPQFSMPTFDTGQLNGDVSRVAQGLNAKVQGQFNYSNDGTEKAVENLTGTTVTLLDRLITAVEDGKVLMVDEEVLGKTAEKYARNTAVRMNTVFGGK